MPARTCGGVAKPARPIVIRDPVEPEIMPNTASTIASPISTLRIGSAAYTAAAIQMSEIPHKMTVSMINP